MYYVIILKSEAGLKFKLARFDRGFFLIVILLLWKCWQTESHVDIG